MSAEARENGWQHAQYEALWGDPSPRTAEGQRLWQLFRDGKLGPSPSGIRDFGQRINQIEAEARAEAGTLDEAWAEAEAALPEGADFAVSKTVGVQSGPYVAVSADAGVHAYADSPAAALLALASALRGVPA